MSTGDSPVQRASEAFVAEFARWRVERGMSKKQLAAAMGFDASYVSHVEARRHRPTEDFARRAEAILQTGGSLWQRYKDYDELRATARSRVGLPGRDPPVPDQWLPPGTGLVVEREIARLSYVDGKYRCTIRRALYNAGTEPVTRFLIYIKVDRYPDEPDRSNRHYRDHPLSFDELALVASCAGEPMDWRPGEDRDTYKEVWLLFENPQARFPLYPGQRTTISYSWHVGADKWGNWFERSVRLPTRRLAVEVEFPASMRPVVWGVETSLSAESIPLRTPIAQELTAEGRALFSWETDAPALHARFRLEWRFRSADEDQAEFVDAVQADGVLDEPSDGRADSVTRRLVAAGVVQRGAEVLTRPVRHFSLPAEAGLAMDVVRRLAATLDRVQELHPFAVLQEPNGRDPDLASSVRVRGMGLAAPQLGIGLAAAIVRPPEPGAEQIILLNPVIEGESADSDEQFEGCLSFFDVRGLVRRPVCVNVRAALPSGETFVARFDHVLARLVCHEIDHLEGRLYVDRMDLSTPLLPLDEYSGSGHPWRH
jgi:peptide deformylase